MERGHNWGAGCVTGAKVITSDGYEGKIVATRPRSFDAEFPHRKPIMVEHPKLTGGTMWVQLTHFKRRFRRADGRSVGDRRHISWAAPALLESGAPP